MQSRNEFCSIHVNAFQQIQKVQTGYQLNQTPASIKFNKAESGKIKEPKQKESTPAIAPKLPALNPETITR